VKIDVLLVDYGEVISQSQPPETLDEMAALTRLARPVLVERYWEHRPAYDRGGDARSFWSKVAADAVADNGTLARLVELDVAGWSRINHETFDVLLRAHERGVSLSLLSNAPAELASALGADPAFKVFDHLLFSSRLGAVKPERAIFEAAAEATGTPPCRIAFVDDRPANVDAAAAYGMQTILFESPSQLGAELDDLTRAP
jgi:putative hydrolase of the HAD superfamily